MVAVRHHMFDATGDVGPLARAVAEVGRLAADLPRPLLAATPGVVRTLAARAVEADRAAAVRRRRVGTPPAFTANSLHRSRTALAELRAAREDTRRSRADAHRMLAFGNAFGLAALAGSAALVFAGVGVGSTPMLVGVLSAASGPLLGAGSGALRRLQASQAVERTAYLASCALNEMGVATYGQLRAAEVQLEAWERRQREATATREVAKRHRATWHRLAGPKAEPANVDALLQRVEALRQAQLRLFGECLRELSARRASEVLDLTAAEVIELTPPPAALPSRFTDVLDRIRGRHLRLWNS